MVAKKPAISVVIPTLGREKVLVDTIKDVLKQGYKDYELVIVDQTITHEAATQKYLDSITDPRLRYFKVGPPSLTAARNFALKVVRAPIVVFIDDDVILSKNFLQEHISIYKKLPKTTAVAGKVVDLVHHWPESATPLTFDKYGQGHGSFNCPTSQPADSFPGGNMSFKVAAARKLGGFDVNYNRTAVREESDMAARIAKSGGSIYYSAEAALDHLAAPYGGTRIKVHPFDNIAFYSNELYFTLRHVPFRHLPIGLAKRFVQALRGQSLSMKLKRSGLFIRGFAEACWKIVFPKTIIATELEASR